MGDRLSVLSAQRYEPYVWPEETGETKSVTAAEYFFGPDVGDSTDAFRARHIFDSGAAYKYAFNATLARQTPAVPQADLSRGARGPDVRALQTALVRLGYMTPVEVRTGPGIFGPRTFSALRRFQREHDVPATGFYGPLTRAALTRALDGRRPVAPPRPDAPQTPAGAARNLNRILRGTGLEGKGEVMLALARRYRIPVELAVAMFRKEASFNRYGYAPQNNNPGNIRFRGQAGAVRGAGGFARWRTLDEGIEAYFKLLDSPTYRRFVDRRDWDGLVGVYAPSNENDTALYARQVKGWINQYRREIYGNSPTAPTTAPDNRAVTIKPFVIYSGGRRINGYRQLAPHHNYQRTSRGEVRDFTLTRPGKPNTGLAIPSPMRGIVIRAGVIGGYGNAVEVQNPQTHERFIIGHMNSINVRRGERVEYGQTIGTQGSTGHSTGPHVHLEAPTAIIRRYIADLLDGKFERVGRDYEN